MTKKHRDRLTEKQAAKLQKALDGEKGARSYADAIKEGRDAQRDHVKALQGDLAVIGENISMHPLSAAKAAKREEIGIARADLAAIVQELADARAKLQSKLDSKHALVDSLKRQLGDDDDDA